MIAIADHSEGCILPVRAQPGSRKRGIVGEQSASLKVAVTAPPEGGKANKALIEELREALKIKRSQIELVSGETSRDKRFLIRGVSKTELTSRLEELLS